MNSLHLAWHHYVIITVGLACLGGASVVACMLVRDGWTWLTTHRRSERRFQNVVLHHRRFSR